MLRSNLVKTLKRLQPWQVTVLVGIGFAIVVVLMTWPAVRYLSQQLIGNNEDTWIFFWNNWWLKEALTNGHNPLQTPFLFFPEGASLIAHSNSFLNSFLAFLLGPFVNPVAAYNLVLLLGLWLGAMGMYLLVKDITEHYFASILAGFIFAFAPYHISQVMAHAHLGSIQWWPFYILFLRRALLDGRWRDAAAAGFFAALTIWTGLQLGVLLALWTLVFMILFLWQRRSALIGDRQKAIRTLSRTAVIGLTALLIAFPLLWAVISNWSMLADSASEFSEGMTKQTDLLSYFVPPSIHPLWGDQFSQQFERFGFNATFTPYIGFAVLILILAAILSRRKDVRIWIISGGIWLLLATGSALRFNGNVFEQMPLPFRWLGAVFPISAIRAPDRFNLLLVLTFSVLAGIGVAWLSKKNNLRWVAGLLGLFVAIEYLLIPIPRWGLPAVSGFLDNMAGEENSYAVVNYPMGYTNSKYWLYYQTIHGKPTVEGHVSRYTSDEYQYIADQPLLNALYNDQDLPQQLPVNFFEPNSSSSIAVGPVLRDLQSDGIRYLLIHRNAMSEDEQGLIDSLLPLIPIYQDEFLEVFDLSEPRPVHFGILPKFMSPDVDLIQVSVKLDQSESAIGLELLTQKTSQVSEVPDCQLHLDGTESKTTFSPFPGAHNWQEGDLAQQKLRLSIPDNLSSGLYGLQIACPDVDPFTELDSVVIEDGRPSLLLDTIDLQFDDLINLDGYRWWFEKSDLHLVLQWRSRDEIDLDFKVFVHLVDDTGTIIWQYDGLHCNWLCPTSQWSPNQIVTDETVIPMWDLPSGTYQIALGLYDEESGDRLIVRDAKGNVVPESYYILDDNFEISREP